MNPLSLPPTLESFAFFQEILKRKRGPDKDLIYEYLAVVEFAYVAYEYWAPQIDCIANISFGAKVDHALCSMYSSRTSEVARLKTDLAAQLFGNCWYCGMSIAAALDHILPHKRNPLYAVLPLNLVPSCSECNSKKAELNSNGRQTIHPYRDSLVNERWLYASLDYVGNSVLPRFFIRPPATAAKESIALVESHMRELELYGRFSLRFANWGREQVAASLSLVQPEGAVNAARMLANQHFTRFGCNNFFAVGLEAFAESDESRRQAFLMG